MPCGAAAVNTKPGLWLDVGPTGGPLFFIHLLLEMSYKDVLGLLRPKAALQTGCSRQERRKLSVDRNVLRLRPRFPFFHNLSPRCALHKDPGLIITRKKLHRILQTTPLDADAPSCICNESQQAGARSSEDTLVLQEEDVRRGEEFGGTGNQSSCIRGTFLGFCATERKILS